MVEKVRERVIEDAARELNRGQLQMASGATRVKSFPPQDRARKGFEQGGPWSDLLS